MKNHLIKQAIFLPILYFGVVILASIFADNYSHLGQHASELAINKNKIAGTIFNIGAFITGLSIIAFGIGLLIKYQKRFTISSLLLIVFGITFLFGAIFAIGSPWHGAYGIGLCIVLLPISFLYESKELIVDSKFKNITLVVNVLIFLYFWTVIARLDPMEYRGFTQRIFGLVVFVWMSFIAYRLNKLHSH